MQTLRSRPLRLLALALMALGVPAAGSAQTAVQKVRLVEPEALAALSWKPLADDGSGDGAQPRLPDARELAYAIDPETDRLWWRIALHGEPHRDWFGINIVLDSDQDPENGMSWWGANSGFKFDRLVTAYLYRAEGYWQGVVGVADAEGAGGSLLDNLSRDVAVALAADARAILVGVPRSALARPEGAVRVVGAVGSTFMFNDDLPNEGAASLTLSGRP